MNTSEKSLQQLRPTVLYALDHDLLPTAEFTCERILAQDPDSADSAFLYALTLFKSERYKAAYNAASQHCTTHPGCSYVFAKACMKLEQEPDAISSLTKTMPLWQELGPDDVRRYEPDNIACYMLLAKLYAEVGDVKRSALNYTQVLKLNPYIFEAFEELCKLGAKVKVSSIYKSNNPMGDIQNTLFQSRSTRSTTTESKSEGFNLFKTPVANPKYSHDTGMSPEELLITPRTKHLHLAPDRRGRSDSGFKHPPERKKGRSAASSITSRLLNHSIGTLSGTTVPLNASSITSPLLENETTGSKRMINSTFVQEDSDVAALTSSNRVDSLLKNVNNDYLISIYSKIAKGFRAMTSYDCFRAIRILDSLPENERNTPWVLAKLGRLHFEIVNYEEAENYFIKLRKLDRTRIDDMEYYSTLLWHLHKEVELSFLSHELYEVDNQSPQAWVAVGNLFSLKREPDEAIKCFRKAIKLDKSFAYAYTLQGHEYLANDAFENAMEQFRNAIVLDSRHYNAFYGIGMVYLKLGDFRKAEFHFRKAAEINPMNVILICCVGMVLEKLDKREQALRQYIFASKLQPLSMLALFKKAQALFSMKQYEMALKDFQKLEDLAPDEASVHFILGKLYKYYGKKNDAIKQFTIALNLDPKGSHLIKEALENLQER